MPNKINHSHSENGRCYSFVTNRSSDISKVMFNGYSQNDVDNFAPSFLF